MGQKGFRRTFSDMVVNESKSNPVDHKANIIFFTQVYAMGGLTLGSAMYYSLCRSDLRCNDRIKYSVLFGALWLPGIIACVTDAYLIKL